MRPSFSLARQAGKASRNGARNGARPKRTSAPKLNSTNLKNTTLPPAPLSTYYDPSNSSLDFTKPNHVLSQEIFDAARLRKKLRHSDPASAWTALHGNKVGEYKKQVARQVAASRVSLASTMAPLAVGDAVLLSLHSTNLHIIAAVPQSLESNIYTLVDHEGRVLFATKHHMKVRVPQVVPAALLASLQLVQREVKHPGIAPVGVPEPFHQKQGKKENTAEKTFDVDSEPVGDDFIVAQASAQLLTDTSVQTYIVPESARQVYADCITQISKTAHLKVLAFINKLDYVHRALQYDTGSVPRTSCKTFSVFETLSMVSHFSDTLAAVDGLKGLPDEYKAVNRQIRNLAVNSASTFAKDLPSHTRGNYVWLNHSASSYVAFLVAVLRLGRKWRLNVRQSTRTPISVDMMPLAKSVNAENALAALQGPGTASFAKAYKEYLVTGQRSPILAPGSSIVQAMKDFVAGNISNDPSLQSLMASLVRCIDKEVQGVVPPLGAPLYSYEYSRSRAYEIVMSFEDHGLRNPIQWDEAVGLASKDSPQDPTMFQQFYGYVDTALPTATTFEKQLEAGSVEGPLAKMLQLDFYGLDPMAKIRRPLGNVPVYCIDSATAHEIDDGISIQTNADSYTVTIHVANPTSYLRPDLAISQVAFQKGTTVYLPEGPSMMLPGLLSKVCGLNGNAETRTFAVEFDLAREAIDEYLDSMRDSNTKPALPPNCIAKTILLDLRRTARVKFYTVTNFPKGYTYEKVNAVLEDPTNTAKFTRNALEPGSHENNLFTLFHILTLLKHARVGLLNGLEFNLARPRISVDYTTGPGGHFKRLPKGYEVSVPLQGKSDTPVIRIETNDAQNDLSMSQQLVSNLMIAGNYAGSVVAMKNKLPIIYRTQQMDMADTVRQQVSDLSRRSYTTGQRFSVDEMSQVLSVLVLANFSTWAAHHESIGLTLYLNFTSPLRRFVDMVNHWQFQSWALGELPRWAQADLDVVASHLQGCEYMNKRAQAFSEQFWTGQFLRNYFVQQKPQPQIPFTFLLKSDAKHGDVRAECVGFGALRTTIVQTEFVSRQFALGRWRVGQVVAPRDFAVHKLDYMENEFAVEVFSAV